MIRRKINFYQKLPNFLPKCWQKCKKLPKYYQNLNKREDVKREGGSEM